MYTLNISLIFVTISSLRLSKFIGSSVVYQLISGSVHFKTSSHVYHTYCWKVDKHSLTCHTHTPLSALMLMPDPDTHLPLLSPCRPAWFILMLYFWFFQVVCTFGSLSVAVDGSTWIPYVLHKYAEHSPFLQWKILPGECRFKTVIFTPNILSTHLVLFAFTLLLSNVVIPLKVSSSGSFSLSVPPLVCPLGI